jgi:hypothetical protein
MATKSVAFMSKWLKPMLQFPRRSKINASKLRKRRRSLIVLILLLLGWSLCLGLGLAQAIEAPKPSAVVGTVDVVPDRYKFGQELYLENCATCHIGVPPAVLPTQTWRDLLQDSQHYGVEITPLIDPPRRLVWNYLQTFSRQVAVDEKVPYRVFESQYFKVLHPKVELPQKLNLSSCVTCHPGASQFNFRSLTAEWENSP